MTSGVIFCIVSAICIALFFALLFSSDAKYGPVIHKVKPASFKEGDRVSFMLDNRAVTGRVRWVDKNGTFETPNEICYDIIAEINGVDTIIKHLPHSSIL